MTAPEALRNYSVALRACITALDTLKAAQTAEERATAQTLLEAAQDRVDDARTQYEAIQKKAP